MAREKVADMERSAAQPTPDTHLREVNAALVEALREIEAKARDLADDAMTNQRGLWLACANEARAALARATTQEQGR